MKVWILKEEGCCDEHEPGYHVIGVYPTEELADQAEAAAKEKASKEKGRDDYTSRYSEEYELTGVVGEEKLLEQLVKMRANSVLDRIDERYAKGHRDALDLLVKWMNGQ